MGFAKTKMKDAAHEAARAVEPINYFDRFCHFVRAQSWMSKEFGDELVLRFMAGQKDAYERGEQHAKEIIKASIK